MAGTTQKGRRISVAKKGKPQIPLGPDEVTLSQAVKVTGYSRKVLRDGVDDRRLSHRLVERPGKQPDAVVFHLPTLREELARQTCSYPGCDCPAPGRSGRCGDHVAGVKHATVELVCRYSKCGRAFTRPGSWLRENPDSRGHYCSNQCKGLAFAESRPGQLQVLNPDGAREHHGKVRRQVAELKTAEQLLDVADVAARCRVTPQWVVMGYYLTGLLPGEVRSIYGTRRLLFREDAFKRFLREWVLGGDRRRESWLDPDSVVARLEGRGLLERFVAGPVMARDVEEALRKRVKARRRAILPHGGGAPPSVTAAPHNLEWSTELDQIEADLWEEREWDINLQLALGPPPTRWAAARELGQRLDPENPARATAKIWKADKRVKSLQTSTNRNYPGG